METDVAISVRPAAEPSRYQRLKRAAVIPRSWHRDLLVVSLLAAATVTVHLWVPGLVPSGADGGNWLAITKERLGMDVMSSEVSYLPLFPSLVALFSQIAGSVTALVTAALITKIALVVAVYLSTRTLGFLYSVTAAVIVGAAGAQMEAYAWGGYAQLLGTAVGLLAVFFVVRYLDTDSRPHLVVGIVCALFAYLTHALVGGLLLVALPIGVLYWLLISRPRRREWIQALWITTVAVAPGVLYLSLSLSLFFGAETGVEPVLNPLELNRWFAVTQTVRDAPLLWTIVGLIAIAGFFLRGWTSSQHATIAVGLSWVVAGLSFFALTGEPRALLLVQTGLVILAVTVFKRLYEHARYRATARHRRNLFPLGAYRTIAIVGISMLSGLVVGGLTVYSDATNWYRVVDHQELEGLDILNQVSDPDSLVVASRGHHGNPIGWWVEGYGERPTYSGLDTRFLAFPDEREQAEIANGFFSGEMSDSEARGQLQAIGADFLVVDRRGPDAAWLDSGLARSLPVVFDSETIVVLGVEDVG